MNQPITRFHPTVERYEALMDIVRNRLTTRAFRPDIVVPRAHIEMVLEAARHAPSGANAQPWHYIVVTQPQVKKKIADYFVAEQRRRAKLKMKFPTPNYHGLETAPGFIVIAADFRFVRAFPILLDGSDLDKQYRANAERILLQSVAASTMSAHLAAAALGYQVWWVSAIGQEHAQKAIRPLLGATPTAAWQISRAYGEPSARSAGRRNVQLKSSNWYSSVFNNESHLADEHAIPGSPSQGMWFMYVISL